MHACPLFAVDPSPFASPDALDAGIRRFETILDAARSAAVPVAIHLSGPLLSELANRKIEPDLGRVEWVRTGWGAPDLTSVPEGVATMALGHEAEAMRRIGVEPGALWVRGWWDRRIPQLVSGAGIDCLLLHEGVIGDRIPGVVAFLDKILPVIPVTGHTTGPDDARDGLVMVALDGSRPEEDIDRVRTAYRSALMTPGEYLRNHRPTGRYAPSTEAPVEDRESAKLRRKMVRLATRTPDKISPAAAEALLAGCHGPAHTRSADPSLRVGAHAALIRARRLIDTDRRRGDEWSRVSRIDWDADGIEEVQIELPRLSLVIDPEAEAELVALDDKSAGWPANVLDDQSGGSLCRLATAGDEQVSVAMSIESVEEGKGYAGLSLQGEAHGGDVRLRLRAASASLTLGFQLEGLEAGRLGPELFLALGDTQVRVDGSEWATVDDSMPLSGHRFRLQGNDRQVLISSLTPADLFIMPAPGGVVAWLNWAVEGAATHEVSIDLDPS